ncbi:MAG: putative toxin-antitoxin system toxin component, PIN family [Acidobacteria bacterium]|nr:putative toxin-antitoxin system toxin component, PIN family [Acidobacteriota bacterium]
MSLKIILDTNVLVAAFRSRKGAANRLLKRIQSEEWQINVSTPLLLEYETVLKRPEMTEFISHNLADEFIDGLCAIAECHDVFFLWRLLVRDPNDAFVFELAVRTNSNYLITFNKKDFPAATEFGVKLVTPKEFLEVVGEPK